MKIATYYDPTDPTIDCGVSEFRLDSTYRYLPVPDGVFGVNSKTSFAKWINGTQRRLYMCGGHSENIMMAEDLAITRLNIPPIKAPIIDTATPTADQIGIQKSGTGLTGSGVVYLRWSSSATGRRSPLSDGCSLTFANEGISLSNVPVEPTPYDPSVDTLEIWVALDDDYPRHLSSRQAGQTAYSTEDVDLGEADTDTITHFPKCKYVRTYHDRLVMAGDDIYPDRVYFSLNGEMEYYAGLYASTKNGEAITGIYVVRDSLIVQTATSHYVVQGYDENDIQMGVLSPSIGGLGHHTVILDDDMAFFPSKSGWYACNGNSLTLIGGGDFNETWAREQHWRVYANGRPGWCIHDEENKIIKYKAPNGSAISPMLSPREVNSSGVIWVLDYRAMAAGTGGIKLSLDTCSADDELEPTASAMLVDNTGNYRLYTGHASGKIALDNVFGMPDIHHAFKFYWHSPQISIASPGDDADCAAVVKLWFYLMNEDIDLEWTMFAGNSYDWQAQVIAGQAGGRQIGGAIPSAMEVASDSVRVYRDRFFANNEESAGSSVSVMISGGPIAWEAVHAAFDGAPTMYDGSVFQAPMVSIRGWGFTYKQYGEDSRGVRSQAA